ncbi:hypothetical protein GLAREA_00853 [Glarea lozoyensis ATCC 20868]|uniref:Uncharacterized protein n=1 Tax=Glarea lozoyensis (strain ATCC 20868 / MF5171) TaxID=1116229 RepID=S3DTF1_GLAL2|nr:uncharacterized protein GLAREA_00853 [Glarea lozoyensis ATCC 20868]EPE29693.1 hypothetical protein GLAREA_00853 [Glarea lozoyensis ATCC 20868]
MAPPNPSQKFGSSPSAIIANQEYQSYCAALAKQQSSSSNPATIPTHLYTNQGTFPNPAYHPSNASHPNSFTPVAVPTGPYAKPTYLPTYHHPSTSSYPYASTSTSSYPTAPSSAAKIANMDAAVKLLKEMTAEMKKGKAKMSKEEFLKKYGGAMLMTDKNTGKLVGAWMPGMPGMPAGGVGGMGKGLGEGSKKGGLGKAKEEEEDDVGPENWELDCAYAMFMERLDTPESLSPASSPSTSPPSFKASSSKTPSDPIPGNMDKKRAAFLVKMNAMSQEMEAVRAQIWECRDAVDRLLEWQNAKVEDGGNGKGKEVEGKGKEVMKEEKTGEQEGSEEKKMDEEVTAQGEAKKKETAVVDYHGITGLKVASLM